MRTKVTYELGSHRNNEVIFIRFERNTELNARIKKLVGVRWSQSQKAWYVLATVAYREKFGIRPKPIISKIALNGISEVNKPALQKYVETLQLRAYSPKTITTYKNEFTQLLNILKDKSVAELDANRLRDYFLFCTNTLKLSENTLHSRINAVKFYFEKVLGRERFFYEIPRPKKTL